MTALTDQAIAEIKNLIMSGEFAAGSKLPKEPTSRSGSASRGTRCARRCGR